MDEAIRLYQTAESTFKRSLGEGQGGRLVLSLYFKAALGVQRIFHFDSLTDVGFALLTGGRRILSRDTLGSLVRAAPTRAVSKFVRLTQPVLAKTAQLALSIDEHTVARFTRKFLIPKGFHTIRNKKMRAEKLFFSFEVGLFSLLDLVVTPGNGRLARVTSKMVAALRARCPSAPLRLILDAGAAHSHKELLELADAKGNQVLLVRAPRRKAYLDRWKALPEHLFTDFDEPGRYTRAPPKRIHVTETRTSLRAGPREPARDVRTIVVREEKRRGKDRWHALFIFRDDVTPAYQLVQEFRTRQHHEQTYRILLHDAYVDTVPSGYNKKSPNPDRPGFRKNAITLYAWVAGLAVNALTALSAEMPKRFHLAHPRTLRRWWLNFPADLYLAEHRLFVVLRPRWHRSWWKRRIEKLNARNLRVPWLDDRLVLYSLDAPAPQSAEPSCDPPRERLGVWC